jgi:hypothetical protein
MVSWGGGGGSLGDLHNYVSRGFLFNVFDVTIVCY